MFAWDVTQTLRANDVALGTEVAVGKSRKNPEWLRLCHPLMTNDEIMENISEQRLAELEADAMSRVMGNNQ